ncbi:MAG: glycosyltransferase family 4 protein [Hyphomonadaceae bacterium]|nr:glycosyltransferase family 4 protein [Hyphomonadaceae bacterium]
MKRPKLLFLITEDWFFRSHFLPMARRAVADGYDVVVAARLSGALDAIDGVRVVDTPFPRGSLRPWVVGRQVAHLRALLAQEQPDIVHAIALKPIALLILSHAHGVARAMAVTGRGYIAGGRSLSAVVIQWRLQRMLRRALRQPRTLLLVENEADRRWVAGCASEHLLAKTVLLPGAGVNPDAYVAAPEPQGPIVVGVAARLIASKGIDLAVAAVRRLRQSGRDIELRIAGAADEQNPDHVSAETIASWQATPGVTLCGHVSDISAFWAQAHIACLPSRGGEGLPRSLLEAAACGRPIVTTLTPGCADLVRHTESGLVVPVGDVDALAEALQRLALDAHLRRTFGAAGRLRVIAGYTEAHVADAVSQAWRRLLNDQGREP